MVDFGGGGDNEGGVRLPRSLLPLRRIRRAKPNLTPGQIHGHGTARCWMGMSLLVEMDEDPNKDRWKVGSFASSIDLPPAKGEGVWASRDIKHDKGHSRPDS